MSSLRHLLCVFAATLLLGACSSSDTPEEVTRHFLEAVYKNEPEQAFKLIDIPKDAQPGAEDMVRGKLKGQLAENARKTASLGGLSTIEVTNTEYNPDKTAATTSATVSFKNADAPKRQEQLRLVKGENGWKIRL
ncbi:hypothetical protein BJP27_09325 [Pseudomonas oryzihabitans]|nr:hypothetical protein BJP27_09325 [Pseudomonas psychrotolerans]